jgi:hypothetical protein
MATSKTYAGCDENVNQIIFQLNTSTTKRFENNSTQLLIPLSERASKILTTFKNQKLKMDWMTTQFIKAQQRFLKLDLSSEIFAALTPWRDSLFKRTQQLNHEIEGHLNGQKLIEPNDMERMIFEYILISNYFYDLSPQGFNTLEEAMKKKARNEFKKSVDISADFNRLKATIIYPFSGDFDQSNPDYQNTVIINPQRVINLLLDEFDLIQSNQYLSLSFSTIAWDYTTTYQLIREANVNVQLHQGYQLLAGENHAIYSSLFNTNHDFSHYRVSSILQSNQSHFEMKRVEVLTNIERLKWVEADLEQDDYFNNNPKLIGYVMFYLGHEVILSNYNKQDVESFLELSHFATIHFFREELDYKKEDPRKIIELARIALLKALDHFLKYHPY